jgi:hypothetical protein
MRRSHLIVTLAGALVALALAEPAAAKNLQAMTICGPDACSQVPRADLSIELVEGGGSTLPPGRAEPWYRVGVTVGGGGGHENWWMVVLPTGGYTGFPDGSDGDLQWGSISPSSAALYRRLAGDLRPFPAARLHLVHHARVAAPATGGPAGDATDDGGHGIAIAGAVGGAALLVAVVISLYRRRS